MRKIMQHRLLIPLPTLAMQESVQEKKNVAKHFPNRYIPPPITTTIVNHQSVSHHHLSSLILSSFFISRISISASLTQMSATSLPTLHVRRVTPLRSMTALALAHLCVHRNSFLPMPSPGLLGRPSSLHAVLSRCLRAEVVKERVLLLPLRRGGGGGAKGRELAEDGSKAGSRLFCFGGLPYGMSACHEPGIEDVSVFVSFRLPRPRRFGKGGGCLGLETERWTWDSGECLFG
jgi:hypothetical protein